MAFNSIYFSPCLQQTLLVQTLQVKVTDSVTKNALPSFSLYYRLGRQLSSTHSLGNEPRGMQWPSLRVNQASRVCQLSENINGIAKFQDIFLLPHLQGTSINSTRKYRVEGVRRATYRKPP